MCQQCGREFKPSSGHLRCASCRSRNPCACGALKHKDSHTCAGCFTQAGPANPNWKGGGTRHHAGYLMTKARDHPRARPKGYYVFDHVLVMEGVLGRYLAPGESVHHINGVKDDNRPENLELWTRPQPSGIRVDDAIAWAREILALYEPPASYSADAGREVVLRRFLTCR